MATRSAAPFILRLAFRNLSRHGRRTGLTIFALAFGIALMVLGQAWTDAMERAVVEPAKNATLGAAVIVFFSRYGIPAFSEAQTYTYGGDRLFPMIKLRDVLLSPLTMLVVSVVAALIPSVSAARKRPAESLRYV